MFKKHIATANTYTSRIPLEKRREALRSLVQHPNGLSNGNTHDKKKTSAAIDHFQISTNIPPIQRSTNARLADVERFLKTVFKFQNMTFSNFVKNHEALFKQRFKAIQQPGSNSQMTPEVYDSDSEEKSHSEVPQEDIMKLLRLYLRLSIREKELECLSRNPDVRVIGYPSHTATHDESDVQRAQKENGYSAVEGYGLRTSDTVVLSKGSYLSQKECHPRLFGKNNVDDFLTQLKECLNHIQIHSDWNPFNDHSEQSEEAEIPNRSDAPLLRPGISGGNIEYKVVEEDPFKSLLLKD